MTDRVTNYPFKLIRERLTESVVMFRESNLHFPSNVVLKRYIDLFCLRSVIFKSILRFVLPQLFAICVPCD